MHAIYKHLGKCIAYVWVENVKMQVLEIKIFCHCY